MAAEDEEDYELEMLEEEEDESSEVILEEVEDNVKLHNLRIMVLEQLLGYVAELNQVKYSILNLYSEWKYIVFPISEGWRSPMCPLYASLTYANHRLRRQFRKGSRNIKQTLVHFGRRIGHWKS